MNRREILEKIECLRQDIYRSARSIKSMLHTIQEESSVRETKNQDQCCKENNKWGSNLEEQISRKRKRRLSSHDLDMKRILTVIEE